MERPFQDPVVLQQMLVDRANGWSLASLMKKYGIKSHRSIVYQAKKHGVKSLSKPTVYYHAIPVEVNLTIRKAVREFPLRNIRPEVTNLKNYQLVETISWWVVEKHIKDNNIQGRPMFSFTL